MPPTPEAREMLLKARVYRLFAIVFAIAGLAVFCILYARNVEGTFFSSLTNPFMVVMVLFPFLPALVLSLRASKMEREYAKKFLQTKSQNQDA